MVSTLFVKDYMSETVLASEVSDSVFDTAEKMIKYEVGSIVITEKGKVVGITTKGDVIKKTVLKQIDPKKTRVSEIMSKPVLTISPESSLEDASHLMSENKVSKLPVTKDGQLVGIITSTDLIRIEPTQIGYLKNLLASKK